MIERNKPGIGRYKGDDYQLWYAVKLISYWILDPPKLGITDLPWLKLEIGVKKFGIFDDVLMYLDSRYYFYQAKSTSNVLGDIISENNLLNDDDKLSINKLYYAYKKITAEYSNNEFNLIIVSNRAYTGSLRQVLIANDGHIEEPFISGKNRLGEKLELRELFKNKLKNPDDFEDFLRSLIFIWEENPEYELKINPSLPPVFIEYVYNLVKKNAMKESISGDFKIRYDVVLKIYQMDEVKEKIPLKIGIYSKLNIPKSITYEESIDLKDDVDKSLDEIDWSQIYKKISDFKKLIEDNHEKKTIILDIKAHLTIGFIVGFIFRRTTGYKIIVNQLDEYWNLEEKNYKINLKKLKKEMKIKIKKFRDNNQSLVLKLNFTNKDVNTPSKIFLESKNIKKKVMIEISLRRLIKKYELRYLVNIILDKIQNNLKYNIQKIYLFNSIPIGLAIFLGYNFNALPPIYLYEFDNTINKYVQSIILK